MFSPSFQKSWSWTVPWPHGHLEPTPRSGMSRSGLESQLLHMHVFRLSRNKSTAAQTTVRRLLYNYLFFALSFPPPHPNTFFLSSKHCFAHDHVRLRPVSCLKCHKCLAMISYAQSSNPSAQECMLRSGVESYIHDSHVLSSTKYTNK